MRISNFLNWFKKKNHNLQEESTTNLEYENYIGHEIELGQKQINETIHILNNTKNPDTFFTRQDFMSERVSQLIEIVNDSNGINTGDNLEEYLKEFEDNKFKRTHDFIIRYYNSIISKINDNTSSIVKANNAKKFFDSLIKYKNHLDNENLDLINKLHLDLADMKKEIKLTPIFENGALNISLDINGIQTNWHDLSYEEKKSLANMLHINTKKENTSSLNNEVIIEDDFVSIPKVNFYGFNPVYSKDNEYMICSNDGHQQVIDGKNIEKKGSIVVCKGNRLLFKKIISRPHDCKASNNGTFIVNNWTRTNLCGIFLIFNVNGEKIFEKKVNANLYNNGISVNGKYACFQTANSDNDDGFKLFIIDIMARTIIARFTPIIWAKSYTFDEENSIITLNDDDYNYRYTLDGTFLDEALVEKQRIERAFKEQRGDLLKQIASEQTETLESLGYNNLDDYSDIILMLSTSLEKEMSDYQKASVCRQLGELYEKFGDLQAVLTYYEQACELYPKIGVKRKITSLKNELGITP